MRDFRSYQDAFKAYDIRGIREKDIDSYFAYLLWVSIGKQYAHQKILIGMDTRIHNQTLLDHLITGLRVHGVQVVIAWQQAHHSSPTGQTNVHWYCSTSLLYALIQEADAWIVISASHNPAEYVGFKVIKNNLVFMPTATLLQRCQETYEAWLDDTYAIDNTHTALPTKAYEKATNVIAPYFAWLPTPRTIVIDYSNGAACAYEQHFLSTRATRNGHTLIELNAWPDGTFSSHTSDTSNNKNYEQLMSAVLQHQADIGIMFDGDADRIGVVDNLGQVVPWDVVLALIIQQLNLEKEHVVFDVMCGHAIRQTIKNSGNIPVVCKMGRYFINEKMKETGAAIGWEISWHIMFSQLGNTENTLVAISYLLHSIEEKWELHEQIEKLTGSFYREPMINLRISNPDKALESLAKHFSYANPQVIDWLNIANKDICLTARKSNTEPLLRIQLETTSPKLYASTMKEIQTILDSL